MKRETRSGTMIFFLGTTMVAWRSFFSKKGIWRATKLVVGPGGGAGLLVLMLVVASRHRNERKKYCSPPSSICIPFCKISVTSLERAFLGDSLVSASARVQPPSLRPHPLAHPPPHPASSIPSSTVGASNPVSWSSARVSSTPAPPP